MPVYRIEQYEIHFRHTTSQRTMRPTPSPDCSWAKATPSTIVGVHQRRRRYGMPVSENQDLSDQLFDRGTINGHDEIIPSIR